MNTQLQTAPGQVIAIDAQEYARLLAENQALKANQPKPVKGRTKMTERVSVNIGEKGGISIYGLNNKFPVTLYVEQFEALVAAVPAIQAFALANTGKLTRKPLK